MLTIKDDYLWRNQFESEEIEILIYWIWALVKETIKVYCKYYIYVHCIYEK